MAILTIRRIAKRFGGIKALDGIDAVVESGELVGIIGPNGSGKTTLFNCITGDLVPDAGEVLFSDTPITGWPPHLVALQGVIRTYQQTEVFSNLSARENLLIAGQEHQRFGLLPSLMRIGGIRSADERLEDRATGVMDLLDLTVQGEEYAGNLSYGQRKLLAIGMALMADVKVLLLDEPTAAVSPTGIAKIVDLLRTLHDRGYTILLVEHNLPMVMEVCGRVVVLNSGRKLTEGPPEDVRHDPRVLEAYFGT